MRLVVIESPYAGDTERNLRYARAAMRDALLRGEAPLASHALYTQPGVLNDDEASERRLGIEAGLAWGMATDAAVVAYMDLGMSSGMAEGVRRAAGAGRSVEYRYLGGEWS